MLSHYIKAGAAIALLLANVQMVAAQVQAQDLAASNQVQSQTAPIKAASFKVAESNYNNIKVANTNDNPQSDNQMSPMPETGNLAMLITGICLIGFAMRRQTPTA